jgi:tetratricopeptide (TPR) repeat protein
LLSFYKRYSDTILCFERAIAIDPLNIAAYKNIQVLFKTIKDGKLLKKAIELMEDLIKKNADN